MPGFGVPGLRLQGAGPEHRREGAKLLLERLGRGLVTHFRPPAAEQPALEVSTGCGRRGRCLVPRLWVRLGRSFPLRWRWVSCRGGGVLFPPPRLPLWSWWPMTFCLVEGEARVTATATKPRAFSPFGKMLLAFWELVLEQPGGRIFAGVKRSEVI